MYSGPTEIPKLADNTINFHAILNGMQTLTTVMIKNIPMRFSQQDLLQMIQERHSEAFDYFYLPMDLKVSSGCKVLDHTFDNLIIQYICSISNLIYLTVLMSCTDAVQSRIRLHQFYSLTLHLGLLSGVPRAPLERAIQRLPLYEGKLLSRSEFFSQFIR